MISAGYARMMARYNAWQNSQLSERLEALGPVELLRDRGAFFGSIQGTLNHLLWGDGMWMARFDGGAPPSGDITQSASLCAGLPDWMTDRLAMDRRIVKWADGLSDDRLDGDLSWFSGAAGRQVSKPLGLLVVHMFNHQTHHRGQIHQMLTETGSDAPVSDLFFLPEET
ncbi:DinB family protein [Primorskyibacter sp. S87]|uniref:DinB family protein n=1 Tax=Primorskyibacter sp. S87 TaxID=3415126 RepID=UPI003C7CB932